MNPAEIGALVFASALVACSPAEYSAQYSIPDADAVVGVQLTQSHLFLAEYDRVLFFGPVHGPFERTQLFPDTGGYSLVNLYRQDASTLLVNTIGNHVYRLRLESPGITEQMMNIPERERVPAGTEYLGAFDFDKSRGWRFITAGDRTEREIGKLYANEQPHNYGVQLSVGAPSTRAWLPFRRLRAACS